MRRNLSAYCAYQNKEKKINSILKKLLYEKKKIFYNFDDNKKFSIGFE